MACVTLKRSLELDSMCSRPSPSKRRRCSPVSSPVRREKEPSAFAEVTPVLSMDQITNNIREEVKRLHRRKLLTFMTEREGSNSPGGPSSPNSDSNDNSSALPSSQSKFEKHLFTFRQVGMICERLLKEREDSLRELYDEVLNNKLAEQYDTFVKFTHDQIQKRFDTAAAPSYLS